MRGWKKRRHLKRIWITTDGELNVGPPINDDCNSCNINELTRHQCYELFQDLRDAHHNADSWCRKEGIQRTDELVPCIIEVQIREIGVDKEQRNSLRGMKATMDAKLPWSNNDMKDAYENPTKRQRERDFTY